MFGKVISHNALRYIVAEGSFFHFIHENPGAAAWMITWIKMLQMSPTLRTMRHGMHTLTEAMLERLRMRAVEIQRARVLVELEAYGRDKVRLHFAEGQSCIARHVVLALPEHGLSRIDGLPPSIRALFGSVLDIPHRDLRRLPAREMHYRRRDGKGLIMVYADRPYLNFWSQYIRKGYETRAEIDGDKELPQAFARFMNIDPKRILSYGIRHWGIEPYGAACHLWKPGVLSWNVQDRMAAFSLERHAPLNVHICGEAFSDYQGFIEGALRSAHQVVDIMSEKTFKKTA